MYMPLYYFELYYSDVMIALEESQTSTTIYLLTLLQNQYITIFNIINHQRSNLQDHTLVEQ
jgi:hypothetical protein